MTIDLNNNIGPYMGISRRESKTFGNNGRTFTIAVYGAYNAMGLIGSEGNGIVVLDEDNLLVVCDEIAKESSGWFGPSTAQIVEFLRLVNRSWTSFQQFINDHPRTRQPI